MTSLPSSSTKHGALCGNSGDISSSPSLSLSAAYQHHQQSAVPCSITNLRSPASSTTSKPLLGFSGSLPLQRSLFQSSVRGACTGSSMFVHDFDNVSPAVVTSPSSDSILDGRSKRNFKRGVGGESKGAKEASTDKFNHSAKPVLFKGCLFVYRGLVRRTNVIISGKRLILRFAHGDKISTDLSNLDAGYADQSHRGDVTCASSPKSLSPDENKCSTAALSQTSRGNNNNVNNVHPSAGLEKFNKTSTTSPFSPWSPVLPPAINKVSSIGSANSINSAPTSKKTTLFPSPAHGTFMPVPKTNQNTSLPPTPERAQLQTGLFLPMTPRKDEIFTAACMSSSNGHGSKKDSKSQTRPILQEVVATPGSSSRSMIPKISMNTLSTPPHPDIARRGWGGSSTFDRWMMSPAKEPNSSIEEKQGTTSGIRSLSDSEVCFRSKKDKITDHDTGEGESDLDLIGISSGSSDQLTVEIEKQQDNSCSLPHDVMRLDDDDTDGEDIQDNEALNRSCDIDCTDDDEYYFNGYEECDDDTESSLDQPCQDKNFHPIDENNSDDGTNTNTFDSVSHEALLRFIKTQARLRLSELEEEEDGSDHSNNASECDEKQLKANSSFSDSNIVNRNYLLRHEKLHLRKIQRKARQYLHELNFNDSTDAIEEMAQAHLRELDDEGSDEDDYWGTSWCSSPRKQLNSKKNHQSRQWTSSLKSICRSLEDEEQDWLNDVEDGITEWTVNLDDIIELYPRRFKMRDHAVEIYCRPGIQGPPSLSCAAMISPETPERRSTTNVAQLNMFKELHVGKERDRAPIKNNSRKKSKPRIKPLSDVTMYIAFPLTAKNDEIHTDISYEDIPIFDKHRSNKKGNKGTSDNNSSCSNSCYNPDYEHMEKLRNLFVSTLKDRSPKLDLRYYYHWLDTNSHRHNRRREKLRRKVGKWANWMRNPTSIVTSSSMSSDNNSISFIDCGNDPLHDIRRSWQRGLLSNYDYLMRLNAIAGRTSNDVSHYPIMPWVLSNYSSRDVPDLTKEENYRDLSKPMGALDQDRLESVFLKKHRSLMLCSSNSTDNYLSTFDDCFSDFSFSEDSLNNVVVTERCSLESSYRANTVVIPPFMYGSHYSSSGGVVLHYLVRLQPFAALHQRLQGGRFDVPNRLFSSIQQTYDMCSKNSPTEVKELTPEWYSDPSFLRNGHNFELGSSVVDGKKIHDVELPLWAGNNPEKFVKVMRKALESDICSRMLPHWIDLIFGIKQRGSEANRAFNTFYHLTYYDATDVARVRDRNLRRETEHHIADFGHCPTQLFFRPHPSKIQRNPSKTALRTSSTSKTSNIAYNKR
eukprot:CAMPEP_0194360978 /NCGR_PEP_ID=MMETSP0174-20130528/8443_1 /TAXON_ID=216777 /ORGANISM="Proboscia alata, Strain PI-D3" /LENGTH=1316 /DNA_ID=CAMNT_0039132835 /DNA_START=242 /DNA_END=4192 /DNA_ORIENTATION=+